MLRCLDRKKLRSQGPTICFRIWRLLLSSVTGTGTRGGDVVGADRVWANTPQTAAVASRCSRWVPIRTSCLLHVSTSSRIRPARPRRLQKNDFVKVTRRAVHSSSSTWGRRHNHEANAQNTALSQPCALPLHILIAWGSPEALPPCDCRCCCCEIWFPVQPAVGLSGCSAIRAMRDGVTVRPCRGIVLSQQGQPNDATLQGCVFDRVCGLAVVT
ncbi:hypothetical protein IWZ01DRAFT_344317 [Phyllosticta capitalensis]